MSGLSNRAKPRAQTQQHGVLSEHEEGTPVQEDNLITFTPPPGSRGLQEKWGENNYKNLRDRELLEGGHVTANGI